MLSFSSDSFYIYLPMLAVVQHSTRYIKYYSPLLLSLMIVNGHLGAYLLNQDLKQLEVWNRAKISYG